ncbi:ty3-gypsy retrotransposon protein [Tanacetum coccineum]
MDENTFCGWLKDHKNDVETLAHQQAAASQSQYEALRSELPETFEERVKNRFGPSKYEDPQGALSKLLQLGTMEEYQREFEKLMNRVTDIPETLLISFYVPGLKLHIQRELLVSRPASLRDAFALARITEARLEDQTTPATGTITKPATSMGTQKPVVPRLGGPSTPVSTAKSSLFPKPTGTSKPLAIKWISPAERQERIIKGLCFNCDNRWSRGDKCPGKFLLLMTEEEDDMGVATGDGGEDAGESGDISILNSLIGHGSPRSLQLWGKIGKGDVHVLIDNGSTHNFIRPDVVEKMCLPIKSTKAFKVYIGSGESLLCKSVDQKAYLFISKGWRCWSMTMSIGFMRFITSPSRQKMRPETAGPRLAELEQLLLRFDSLFQVPTTLPPHRLIDHHIHLLPDTKPVNVRPYCYLHYQKEKMEKLVNEMLSQVIIRFSQSPFSSPSLLVKKKDESYCFCVDYRALNAVTVKDKFHIPTAGEIFDELGGAIIFTKLDLRAGYHQIRVHERDVYKTTFCTHDGQYEFLVMPFGLTNAPSTFQKTMNRLFAPYLRKFVIVFFDDILVYITTLAAHLEHLECVFNCLQEHQFYVKKTKCVFGAETLEYLGHMISGRGVKMDPKKVIAVRDWPDLTTQRQVRGFLGLAGYCRRFIKGYATMAAPLTELLRKDGFRWGGQEAAAFQELKQQLSTAPILSLPDFTQEFVVEADASDYGIGAVLVQHNRPISYFSQKLGPRMRAAATYQKELFAIVEVVIQALIQQKYVRKLMGFDFVVEYKPRVANQVVDALSRMYENGELVKAEFMAISQPIVGLLEILKSENDTLEELHVLHQQLDTWSGPDGFRREQGLLIFRNRYYVGTESKLKALLIHEFHDTPSAGHGGVKKMLVGLSALFYWRGMRKSVEDYIKQCTLPLSLIPYPPGASKVAAVDELLMERNEVTRQLKQNLLAAKLRMEEKANRKRRDVEFKVEDKVFVKLQPYRQITLAKRLSNKLSKRIYWPYEIVERIEKVAYRLALPITSKIHLVFHVSILKLFTGISSEMVTELPDEFKEK